MALLHKLKWNAAGAIVASALTLAAAAGMALLIFGLVRTNDDRAAVRIGAQSTPAAATQLYENALYGIELRLPASWVPDPGYGQTGGLWNGFVSPHGSAGGFMRLDGVGAGSLDAAVDAEAYHKLKPYGDAPVIRSVQLAAGDGVIITPDPTNVHLTDAVLVMPMPRVYGSGGGIPTTYRFPYFDLYARASDIDAIAQSLRFTDPGAWVAPPGPPVASSAPGTEQ